MAFYRLVYRPKTQLWWAKVITHFYPRFLWTTWTTVRFPFQGHVTIAYPATVDDPLAPKYQVVRDRELLLARQLVTTTGLLSTFLLYFFFPLPILFSGRWFVERPAFLHDIIRGKSNPVKAADMLWRYYLYPWPRKRMERWFHEHSVPGGPQ